MPKTYTQKELEKIMAEFESDIPLSKLEGELKGRSAYGIALKMRSLSMDCPNQWDPSKVAGYTRDEIRRHKGAIKAQKRRYRARKKVELIGYAEFREQLKKQEQSLKINWIEFIQYLKEFLRLYEGNKEQFAEEIFIHPSLLSHYLAGRRKPSDEVLARMFDKFIEVCPKDSEYLTKLIYDPNAATKNP
ncbi:hypothetical protein HYW99_04195 [Candidatus Woesearchaeota archaeon]|nr:hypothetical protein [Candidatus Woesearchaeota archaeon]